jgi:hypothetical protein
MVTPPDPWQITLADEFDTCATAMTDQMADPATTGAALELLKDHYQQYRIAASDLRKAAIGDAIAGAAGITAQLTQATTDAKAAATRIGNIADAVGLVASLLVLATAIVTAVATGNPGNLLTAAQSVITAASKI